MIVRERKKSYERPLTFIAIFGDVILINLASILAFLIRFKGTLPARNFVAYLNLTPFITIILCLCYYVLELYNLSKKYTWHDVFFNAIKSVSLGLVIIVAITFFYRQYAFPRTIFLISWPLTILACGIWHILLKGVNNYLRYLFVERRAKTKILIVGADNDSQRIVAELRKYAHGRVNVIGCVDDAVKPEIKLPDFFHWGPFNRLKDVVIEQDVDEVIFASGSLSSRRMMEMLEGCIALDVKFQVVPELLDVVISKGNFHRDYGIPLIDLTTEPALGWQLNLKRIMDITLSVMGLILTFPVVLVIIVAQKITSPGPLIYKQERMGKDGVPFMLYKFRTMIPDAEKKTGPVWSSPEADKRVTALGKIIRKVYMDEVPQLVNILKGEMSFVGPRPERPAFARPFLDKVPFYKNRLLVTPGLTGWAQVHQDADRTIEDVKRKLQYDLHYIENMSVLFDIKIVLMMLAKTLKRALSRGRERRKGPASERKRMGKAPL